MWLTNTVQTTAILYFYPHRWGDTPEVAAQVKAHAESRMGGLLDQLDAELARHGGPWFMGETFTVLDPYVLMVSRWTRGMGRPARDLPHLGPYLQRMLARPATQRAFASEQLSAPLV